MLCKVSNKNNETFGYAVGEFYANKPPITNSLIVTSSDPYHNYTMKTVFNITTINLSADKTTRTWYDTIDDLENLLYYKLLLSVNSKYFIIKPFTYQH